MTIEGHLGDLWPRIFRLCCFTFDIKTNFLTHVYHMLNKSGSWHNQNTTLLNSPVLLQDYSKEGSSLVPDRTMPLEITLLFFFFFFCSLFRAVPTAYGGSQARGLIGAVSCWPISEAQQHQIWAMSATYTPAHGNSRSLTHWVKPGIKPATSLFLVGFVSTAPRWENSRPHP